MAADGHAENPRRVLFRHDPQLDALTVPDKALTDCLRSELFDLDKLILQQNLYGVDLNSESVKITKLSLWLKTARTDRPLNDLDDKIKCGNSPVAPHPNLPPELTDSAFDWQAEHHALTARLVDHETAINDRVYHLFALTPTERRTLDDHMQHAKIAYPLGSA